MPKKSFNNSLSRIIENAGVQLQPNTEDTATEEKAKVVAREEGEKNIAFRIPKSFHRRLRMYTARHEISIKDLIIEILEERMSKDGY